MASLILFSCSSLPVHSPTLKTLSYPHKIKADSSPSSVMLFSLHNLRGKALPQLERYDDPKLLLSLGGMATLSSYLGVIKEKFDDNSLILSHGNLFKGGPLSDKGQGELILDSLKKLPFDLFTVGEDDFSFGPVGKDRFFPLGDEDPQGRLRYLIRGLRKPVVLSNFLSIRTRRKPRWKNLSQTRILKINNFRIGFISILSPNRAKEIILENRRGLYFEEAVNSVITHAQRLRRKKVDALVLLSQLDLGGSEKSPSSFLSQDEIVHQEAELYQTLKRLPPQMIDLVLNSGSDFFVQTEVAGIPVIQTPSGSRFLSWAELDFSQDSLKVVMHDPVKLCSSFFKESESCVFSPKLVNPLEQTPPVFLGETISPDQAFTPLLKNSL